jgi:rhodanese-related sulfurtransferase
MTAPRALAVAAIVLGAAAPFAGSPYSPVRGRIDVADLAATVEREDDHVTAMELAAWIRDRRPGLRVIDVRSPDEFSAYQIPSAENVPLGSFDRLRLQRGDIVVLYSAGGAHAAQAWVFVRSLGHREVFFLSGGLNEWINEVMTPERSTELTRYFGGVAQPGSSNRNAARTDESTADAVKRLRRRGC